MILMQFADTRFFTPFRCSLRSYPCASMITPNNIKESWESDAHPSRFIFLKTIRTLILHELNPDLRTAIPVTVRLLCMHLFAGRREKKEKQKKEKKKGGNLRCQSAFYQYHTD